MNSKQRTLDEALRAYGAAINEAVPDVNSGGCGLFAERIVRKLRKLGIQADPHISCWGAQPDGDPVQTLQTGRCSHVTVCVQLDGQLALVDSNGPRWLTRLPIKEPTLHATLLEKPVPLPVLTRINSDDAAWNAACPRDTLRAELKRNAYLLSPLKELRA